MAWRGTDSGNLLRPSVRIACVCVCVWPGGSAGFEENTTVLWSKVFVFNHAVCVKQWNVR